MIQTIFGSPVVSLKCTNVEELFPESVYNKTVEYLTSAGEKFTNHPLSRGGKIYTTADVDFEVWVSTVKNLDALLNFFKKIALEYTHLYSETPVNDLKLRTSWVNLSYRGCEVNNHRDVYQKNKKSLIVAFYPRAPKGSSDLVFIHNGKEGDWVSDCLEKDLLRIQIADGDIVIFDNLIFHAVDVHNSDIPRMCIAFDFKMEE